MKVKLSEIVQSTEQIKALLEVGFPIKISYRLKRLVNKLNPILEAYNLSRNELVKEFGTENEDKTISVKDPEKLKEFAAKVQELLNVEEDISWFESIKISELGNIIIEPKNMVDFIFEE